MVAPILGVVKLVPDPKLAPPVDAVYQSMVAVPELEVAPKSTVPGPHRSPGAVLFIFGVVLTVATTSVRGEELQPFSVVSTKYDVVTLMLGMKSGRRSLSRLALPFENS